MAADHVEQFVLVFLGPPVLQLYRISTLGIKNISSRPHETIHLSNFIASFWTIQGLLANTLV